jgi:hypothetical protein
MDFLGDLGINVEINCFSENIEACKDLGIPWGEDWTFQMMLGDLVDSAQALVKYAVQYVGSDFSPNLLKAVNALRCALTNLGTNAWNLIAALYWALVGIGQEETAVKYLDMGYEYICTCQEDARNVIKALGGVSDNTNMDEVLGSCSEIGSVKKNDAKASQEERRQKEEDAKAAAAKEERMNKIVAETETELSAMLEAADSNEQLEDKQLKAFDKWQAEASRQDAAVAAKTAITDEEVAELEEFEMKYEAIRTVKTKLRRAEVAKQLSQAKAVDGLTGLTQVAEAASEA